MTRKQKEDLLKQQRELDESDIMLKSCYTGPKMRDYLPGLSMIVIAVSMIVCLPRNETNVVSIATDTIPQSCEGSKYDIIADQILERVKNGKLLICLELSRRR